MGKESACSAGDTGDTGSIPGLEDSLEDGMIAHPTILVQRIPWAEAWWATVHRVAKSQTQLKQLSMHLEKKNHQMALFSIDGTILRTHTHTHRKKKPVSRNQ